MAGGGHGGWARRLQISSVRTKILCQVIPRVSPSLSWSRTSSQVSLNLAVWGMGDNPPSTGFSGSGMVSVTERVFWVEKRG